MKLGTLIPVTGHETVKYKGSLATTSISFGAIYLIENLGATHENAPRYRICIKSPAGDELEIGAAWERIAQRGKNAGQAFFSLAIDTPELEKPLYVAAFRNNDNGYDIIWSRPRNTNALPSENSNSSEFSNQSSESVDDEIPF